MPFHIVEVAPGKFFVENKETGRRYSLNPLSKEMAEKQMKALYARVKN